MFYDKQLEFVCSVFEKSHIHPHFVSPNDLFSEVIDADLLALFNSISDANVAISTVLPQFDGNTIYKITTPYRLCYVYMILPQRAEKNILMIGPYLKNVPTEKDLLELGEIFGLSPKNQKIFEQYFMSIPIIAENSHIFLVVDALGDTVYGKSNFTVVDVESERAVPTSPINDIQDRTLDAALINMKLMEQRYAFENEMMSAVSRGQAHKVSQLMASFNEMSFEQRITDPIRNMKNYSIIMNTLLRKAAESGGVHPVYLDSVSSSYATKIEQMTSLPAITELMGDMFQSYCRLVRRHSMSDYSPTVQKAIVFIESDLSSDLTLSSIAHEQKISSGYLSAVFKKETGKTITEYIRDRRVKHAIYLLETTHLQIQTIAVHCGIVDLQYFSKIFKKHTGKTPKEYRESIKKH